MRNNETTQVEYVFVSNLQNAPIAVSPSDPHMATYEHFRTYHPAGEKFLYVELDDETYRDSTVKYLDLLHECRKNREEESERDIEYLANREGWQRWLYYNGPDFDYNEQDGEVSYYWDDVEVNDDDDDLAA